MKLKGKPILIAFAAGAAAWLLDAAFQVVRFQGTSLANALMPDVPSSSLYTRGGIVVVSLAVGIAFPRMFGRGGQSNSRRKHLSSVLHSIKNAEPALDEEPGREPLLARICEALTDGDGYESAWGVLLDRTSKCAAGVSAGLDNVFPDFIDRYQRGVIPVCVSRALLRRQLVVIDGSRGRCTDCPLESAHFGRASLTARMEHEGTLLGFLSVTIPRRLAQDEAEHEIFQEIVADVAVQLAALDAPEYAPVLVTKRTAGDAGEQDNADEAEVIEDEIACAQADAGDSLEDVDRGNADTQKAQTDGAGHTEEADAARGSRSDEARDEDVLEIMAENERLSAELAATQESAERLSSELATAKESSERLEQARDELAAEIESLRASEAELVEERKRVNDAIEERRGIEEALSTEKQELTEEIERRRLAEERLEAEKQELARELEERSGIEKKLAAEKNELSGELDQHRRAETQLAADKEKLAQALAEHSKAAAELESEKEKLAQALTQHAEAEARLSAEKERLSGELNQHKGSESELAAERERLTQELEESRKAVAALQASRDGLAASLKDHENAHNALEQERQRLAAELEERSGALEATIAQKDALARELEEARTTSMRLESERKRFEQELAENRALQEKHAGRREELNARLSDNEKAANELRAEKAGLEKQLQVERARFEQQLESERAHHEEQINEEKAQRDGLLSDRQTYESERADLEERIAAYQMAISDLESENAALADRLNGHEKVAKELTNKQGGLRQQVAERVRNERRLEAEKAELERRLGHHRETETKLAEEKKRLRIEVEEQRKAATAAAHERDRLASELQIRTAELNAFGEEKNRLLEALHGKRAAEESLMEERERLATELARHEDAQAALASEKERLEKELNERIAAQSAVASERDALAGELELSKRAHESAVSERKALAAELSKHRASLDELKSEKERLTAALAEREESALAVSESKERLAAELAGRSEAEAALIAEKKALETELAGLRSASARIEKESAKLRSSLAESRSTAELAEAERGRLQDELENQKQAIALLNGELAEQQRAIGKFEKAEQALREERDSAVSCVNLADVIFVSIDADETISRINQHGCRLLGMKEADAVGQNWFDCFIPDSDREATREVFRSLMNGGGETGSRVRGRVLTRSGEVRVVEWSNTVITDADGSPTGTLSSGMDVTESEHDMAVRHALYEIANAAHCCRGRNELFGAIRDELGNVINTENFFIALYDKASDTISLPYFVDEKDDFHSFPAGKTLTGRVIRSGSSLLVTKEQARKMAEDGLVGVIGTPAEIWLGVPLRAMGEVIGALVVQSYSDASEFGERERDILEFVSGQVGLAIERRKTEEKLEFLGSIPKQVSDAIIVTDLDFKITYVNRATEELYGYSLAELAGRTPDVLNADSKAGDIQEDIYSTVTGGGTWNGTILNRRKDDTTFTCDFSVSPLREADGRLTSYIAVLRDVSELKRTERLLQGINAAALAVERTIQRDEIFAAVGRELDNLGLSSALLLLDESGKKLRIDQLSYKSKIIKAAERLAGIRRENIEIRVDSFEEAGRVVGNGETVYVADPEPIVRGMLPSHAAKLAKPVMAMLRMRRIIAAPMTDGRRTVGILTVHAEDLTERDVPTVTAFANQLAAAWRKADLMEELKRSFEELEDTQGQLVQAQKMEAVGRLAGGVAHDFNNLLTAITGYTDLSINKLGPDDSVRDDLVQIKKAAGQAANLTKQLLAFSRRQPLSPAVVDINDIVDGMNQMLRPLIGEDIELLTTLQSDVYGVEADAGQIQQVLLNLAVNARDAMPGGGTLTLCTENVTIDTMQQQMMPDARPGDFVCITVQDTGAGIEKTLLSQVFEPFFTTKEKGHGTGLGLSVAYGIVKQHQGWMNVYSEPGRGTTFRIYLPSTKTRPVKTVEARISVPEFKGQMERILLVEDEDAVRSVAVRALSENGYIVTEAASAEEALEVFSKQGNDFDLVFSDVVLPKKSGVELADEIASSHPGLPILLSSGYTDGKSQWPIIRDRGFRFLQKPYAIRDLFRTIREIITEQ